MKYLTKRSVVRLCSFAMFAAALLPAPLAQGGTLPDFRVATYNIWGVPWPFAKDMSRYSDIARELDKLGVDVILMQELFTPAAKKASYVNHNSYYVNGPGLWGKLTSSGVRILSRWPIVHAESRAFSACAGTDCLSKKGSVIATIERPDGLRVDLMDTHLNAEGPPRIREEQLETLALTIKTYRREYNQNRYGINPLVIGGDMNFTPSSEEYGYASTVLQAQDTYRAWADSEEGMTYPEDVRKGYTSDKTNSWHIADGDTGRARLDYLWLENPAKATHMLQVRSSRLIMNDRVRGRHLSDHYGVETTFEVF